MFGLRYCKFQPNEYVLRYRQGTLVREGAGLAFWFYMPHTAIAKLPVQSIDAPFVFEEVTADFQAITLQGQVVFRFVDFKRAAAIFNFAIDLKKGGYLAEDHRKLHGRVVNIVKVLATKRLEQLPLNEALGASEALAHGILDDLRQDGSIESMGIEILSVSLLDVLANKETGRALEARTRELILQDADDALYVRRNSSIEQERGIKENEFNTEVSVENKKRQVQEARLEAQRAIQAMEHQLEEEDLLADIELEKKRRELVELVAQNARMEADAQAYRLDVSMQALQHIDPVIVQALAGVNMQPDQLIAQAFGNLARNAQGIGQLNVSPDLLRELMQNQAAAQR